MARRVARGGSPLGRAARTDGGDGEELVSRCGSMVHAGRGAERVGVSRQTVVSGTSAAVESTRAKAGGLSPHTAAAFTSRRADDERGDMRRCRFAS